MRHPGFACYRYGRRSQLQQSGELSERCRKTHATTPLHQAAQPLCSRIRHREKAIGMGIAFADASTRMMKIRQT